MPLSSFSDLRENQIIRSPFWKEALRIIKVIPIGKEKARIEAEGVETERFYKPILSTSDLSKIVPVAPTRNLEGDPEGLATRLICEQIRLAFEFDPFFGLSVSKIDPVPHQLEAVYDYMLKKAKIRFLLADDPGAGKTIMAGLLLKELKYRGLVNRILIVAPKYLSYQWRRELWNKFHERFRIVDRAVLNSFYGENAWSEINRAITSVDFAKQDNILQSLSDVRWDLVIVDEAHKMAAYRRGKNKIERTGRFKLGRVISNNTDHLLLLTATPHKGDIYNFFLSLSLLDKDVFNPGIVLRDILSPRELVERTMDAIHNEKNLIFLRRMKENLKKLDGSRLFPERKSVTVKYKIRGMEKRFYGAVTSYVEVYYNRATRQKRTNVAFALIIIQRRLASSIRAGIRSLERRLEKIKDILERGQLPEEGLELPEGVSSLEELEDLPEDERWKVEEQLSQLTLAETVDELKLEKEKLGDLVELGKDVERTVEEKKLQELRGVLERENLVQTGNKLLVFTEAKDTLFYLRDKFRQWGYNTTTIHGDKSIPEREKAEKEFNRGNAQIMVATEAAREGINLQEACWLMVNYDIPWNPNRLEQRMGRIHRYGQKKVVYVYNLVAENTREGRVLSVVLDKLDRIREVLGSDKVFDVIGEMFEGVNLERLIKEAIAGNRPIEIYDKLDKIEKEAVEKIKKYTGEALAKKHIDLSRIANLLRKNKEERLPPEYVEEFFVKAFKVFGGRIEQREKRQWYVKYVPAEIRNVSEEFKKKFGRVKERYGRINFYPEVAREEDIEFIAPGHPLLEAVIEKIIMKFDDDLKSGALFYDPEGRYNGIIWFLESTFRDGLNDVASKKMIPIYQPLNGKPRFVNLNLVWDLVPGKKLPAKGYDQLLERRDEIIELAFEKLDEHREQITERREREAEVRKNYAVKSLNSLIAESSARIMRYRKKEREGEDMERPIGQEKRRKDELVQRRSEILRETELEKSITYDNPKVFTAIAVIPYPRSKEEGMYRDEEVERIAMDLAMKYEKAHDRKPVDVSEQNLGYDVKSTSDGEVRYIEVKGRAGEGQIALTTNEWMKAKRLRAEAWLYIVTNTKSNPAFYIINDPASCLKPNEQIRYIVPKEEWMNFAKKGVLDG